MELLIFLGGIVVLMGLGMLLAWPREEERAEHRPERASRARRYVGKA